MNGQSHVLLSVEAEAYIEALEKFSVKDIGNLSWARQHEHIEKLNMQAILSASTQEDEFIKESLISLDKIPVLIHDLLVTEIWKQKIFTEFLAMELDPKASFQIYMVLYHEATVVNLLETVLFHEDSCEAAEDVALDIVDYCYRKLVLLATRSSEEIVDLTSDEQITTASTATTIEELQKKNENLEFKISIKALSLLRYMTDHLKVLPLSVMTRILNTHDVPSLLVELMVNAPWTCRKQGETYKFVDNGWQLIPQEDMFKLTKHEGQVWIALFHLLMGQDCQKKYDMGSHGKNVILKLRSHLTEVVLDQLPVLADMQRYLQHLSMMDPPTPKRDLVFEQIPEIRDRILKECDGRWKKLAKHLAKNTFNPSDENMKEQVKRWTDTYNLDVLESFLPDAPKCQICGETATKRCSRCQNEWYCRRECQVKHWPKHKKVCDLLLECTKDECTKDKSTIDECTKDKSTKETNNNASYTSTNES